jgi:hypothetical protein
MTKMRREKTQINKIKIEKGMIRKNAKEIWVIIGDYIENLSSNKLENLEEMDKFLDTCDYPKLNQKDINHLNIYNKQQNWSWNKEFPRKRKSRTLWINCWILPDF